jgi:uncharacterized protein YeaO (DUF488 family)
MSVTPVLMRVYDPPAADLYRVLVDGLWPRGVSRERAAIDEWLRDIAPSADLRTWFHHDPERFAEFARRYRDELSEPPRAAALAALAERARSQRLAIVTATKDLEHSHAAILRDLVAEP